MKCIPTQDLTGSTAQSPLCPGETEDLKNVLTCKGLPRMSMIDIITPRLVHFNLSNKRHAERMWM